MPGNKGTKTRPSLLCQPRRHKFKGNRFTAERNTELTGESCEKIRKDPDFSVSTDTATQYVIIAIHCIFGRLSGLLKCKTVPW